MMNDEWPEDNPFIFLFFSVSPYYHALNSCFFAQIWVIVRMHASSGKFRTSGVLSFLLVR